MQGIALFNCLFTRYYRIHVEGVVSKKYNDSII